MSFASIADKLSAIMPCEDNCCCCIPRRSTVVSIAIINFFGCVLDLLTFEPELCDACSLADSVRKLLISLFQSANLLLLLASIFETALLLDIYVWYTLGYITMGFVLSIYEFVVRTKHQGARSLVVFVPEVIFLFVIFRCLPAVDLYRKHLYRIAASSSHSF